MMMMKLITCVATRSSGSATPRVWMLVAAKNRSFELDVAVGISEVVVDIVIVDSLEGFAFTLAIAA